MRRFRAWLFALGWLGLAAGPAARADVDLGPTSLSGWLALGARGVPRDPDSDKFREYRDPHTVAFGAGDLWLRDLEDRHYWHFGGYDLGEGDADYFFESGGWGLWGISGSYSLLPHNYSDQARSPYLGVDS